MHSSVWYSLLSCHAVRLTGQLAALSAAGRRDAPGCTGMLELRDELDGTVWKSDAVTLKMMHGTF